MPPSLPWVTQKKRKRSNVPASPGGISQAHVWQEEQGTRLCRADPTQDGPDDRHHPALGRHHSERHARAVLPRELLCLELCRRESPPLQYHDKMGKCKTQDLLGRHRRKGMNSKQQTFVVASPSLGLLCPFLRQADLRKIRCRRELEKQLGEKQPNACLSSNLVIALE